MALGGVIARFASGTYTVTRKAAGTVSVGDYTPGATTTFSIVASVQPISGRELSVLPQGQRGEEVRVVYTLTELKTRTPATEPDTISIGGETWEVFRTESWEAFGATHYRAHVARKVVP